MSRRNLLALVAGLGVFALTACADITGPTHEDPPPPCPVTSGGDLCH